MALVRIVAISDTHGRHRDLTLPAGDVLVHAGDFMASGTQAKEVIDFDDWLGSQRFDSRIVIAGNHDLLFERQPGFARALLTNAHYLENSGVECEGLSFWGQPYVPQFMNWAFMAPRGEAMDRYWKNIPEGIDVLVTHGPPLGFLDLYEGQHVGCDRQALMLARRSFRLVICGHIHTGRGTLQLPNGTLMTNVAIMNDELGTAMKGSSIVNTSMVKTTISLWPPVVFDLEV